MSDSTLTVLVVAFVFLALAAIVVLRLVLRNELATWRRMRFGVFVERDVDVRESPAHQDKPLP